MVGLSGFILDMDVLVQHRRFNLQEGDGGLLRRCKARNNYCDGELLGGRCQNRQSSDAALPAVGTLHPPLCL